jgi:hypothetical protein
LVNELKPLFEQLNQGDQSWVGDYFGQCFF